MQQIPDSKDRRHHLADDGSDSRAHHAPLKSKDEDWVKNDIDDCPRCAWPSPARLCQGHTDEDAAAPDLRISQLDEYGA